MTSLPLILSLSKDRAAAPKRLSLSKFRFSPRQRMGEGSQG